MSNLIHLYQEACKRNHIQFDSHQFVLVKKFQFLVNQLEEKNWLHRFNPFSRKSITRGVYVYGGVGTGKTFLMDLFFNALGKHSRIRLHFFEFMSFIHQELTMHQGMRNPLQWIAKKLAKQYKVLTFDEFFVKDIVDAMVFRRLFEALFSEGMMIVTTSNLHPKELYQNGLQRELFLPAIDLIIEKMDVFHLASLHDYRRLKSKSEETCFFIRGANDEEIIHTKMNTIFLEHANVDNITSDPFWISGQRIRCTKRSDRIIWVNFLELCVEARSARDYLEIVKTHRIVMISGIPKIRPDQKNSVLRFIQLIDVLYEARALLVASFDVELIDIYQKGQYAFDFLRTQSRLHEMDSTSYREAFYGN